MKLFLVILCGVAIACTAGKVETSLGKPNGNATAQQAQPSASPSPSVAHSEQTTPCSLTKAEAPVVVGLKLGMTSEQVLALFPGGKQDPEVSAQLARPPSPLGVSSFMVHPEKFDPNNKFAAFSQFTFTLIDGRVSSVTLGYNGPQYSNVDEFVTRFVEGTKLPPSDRWLPYTGMDNQLKILTCKDFELRVFAGGTDGNLNYVLLTDLDASRQLKERRAKARAQASPTPEPKATPKP